MNEKASVLSTRGPFNSMFARQSLDGFSIDVPCMTSTLYASGFILFQCLGRCNRHILCVDVRPNAELQAASHRESHKSLSYPIPINAVEDQFGDAILRLQMEEVHTHRVLGLFLGDRKFG